MALMTQVGLEFIARNRANQQIGSFTRSVKNLGRQMLYMAGVGGGLYAFKRGFDYVIKKAMEQERVLIELSRALKTTGEYSIETMTRFREFAASIQRVTVYGDEQVLGLMRLTSSLGVSADSLEHATKTAIGLAAATNRDVQSMAQYVALAQQGEFTMLRRYIPALRATTDKIEQLRIVNEFAARGFEVAKAEAESTAGTFKQFKNAVGDLAEEIGDPLLPALTKAAKALTEVMQGKTHIVEMKIKYNRDWLKELGQDIKETWQEPMTLITGKKPEWEGGYGVMPPMIFDIHTQQAKTLKEAIEETNQASQEYFRLLEEQERELTWEEHVQAYKTQAGFLNDIIDSENRRKKLLEEQLRPQREAAERVQQILDSMRAEIKMAGDVSQSWDRSREFVELHDLAIKAAADDLDKYNRIMAEGQQLFEQYKMAERWAEVSRSIESSMSTALENLMQDWRNYGDVVKSILRDILMETLRIMYIRPAAHAISAGISGILGGIFAHSGGIVGRTGFPLMALSANDYEHAPSYHSGKGVPAWVRENEHILTQPQMNALVGMAAAPYGEGAMEIHIHNEGSQKVEISRAERELISGQLFLDIWLRDAEGGGKTAKMIQQVVKQG